jgi:hypothetical protein
MTWEDNWLSIFVVTSDIVNVSCSRAGDGDVHQSGGILETGYFGTKGGRVFRPQDVVLLMMLTHPEGPKIRDAKRVNIVMAVLTDMALVSSSQC